MKAKYIYWYLRKIEEETLHADDIYLRLKSRSFLTEDEVVDLVETNTRTNAYVRLFREYIDFETAGWRYKMFHRRKQNMP